MGERNDKKKGPKTTLGLSELVMGEANEEDTSFSDDVKNDSCNGASSHFNEDENEDFEHLRSINESEPLKEKDIKSQKNNYGSKRSLRKILRRQFWLLVFCLLVCFVVICLWIYFSFSYKKEVIITRNGNGPTDEKKLYLWEYDGPCKVCLPQTTQPLECKMARQSQIEKNRMYYKLTVLGQKETIRFPLRAIPFLNQTMETVKFRTLMDPVDSRWLLLIKTVKKIVKSWQQSMMKLLGSQPFDTFTQYQGLYLSHKQLVENMKMTPVFTNPTLNDDKYIFDGTWMSDGMFVQQRFSGICPFLTKKVTLTGTYGYKWDTLKKILNPSFNFDSAVNHVLDSIPPVTLEKLVKAGRLYILYHEDNNYVKTDPHRFFKEDGDRYTANVTSPIVLFARTLSGDLKVVAIQNDYKPDSPVYTPRSNTVDWLSAKAMVNIADMNYCQAVWHLSHVHFSMSVFCAIFRGHFSFLHPIYQIMRYHCEGTTPHISLAWPTLVAPGLEGHQLLSIGNREFARLAAKGYTQFIYGKLAYDKVLRANGLDSQEISYHPFRDDGLVIWRELKMFATNFANLYYKSDKDVLVDKELQGFANEISIDGTTPPYGGRGKVVGFPSVMKTKEEVITFITRFLWSVPMHAAVNYPLESWGTFFPLSPTKIFYDSRMNGSGNAAYIYPNGPTTIGATTFATLLGNLRVNRIMDYYDKTRDTKLNALVGYHHKRFHSKIQQLLESRNKKRRKQGLMAFSYFEPKWLTNSVHI